MKNGERARLRVFSSTGRRRRRWRSRPLVVFLLPLSGSLWEGRKDCRRSQKSSFPEEGRTSPPSKRGKVFSIKKIRLFLSSQNWSSIFSCLFWSLSPPPPPPNSMLLCKGFAIRDREGANSKHYSNQEYETEKLARRSIQRS